MKIDEFFSKIEALFNGNIAAMTARAEKAEGELKTANARITALEKERDDANSARAQAEKERDDAQGAKAAAEKAKADAEKQRDEARASVPGQAAKIVAGARGEAPIEAGDAVSPDGAPTGSGDIGAQWESIRTGGSVTERSKFFRQNKAAIQAYLNDEAARKGRNN
jgi:multidrug efflux pump subunit AcrA (membrane-fusion protein)